MSHDYDDELERNAERRSRRNPHMRSTSGASSQEGSYRNERERWENRQRKRQEAAERELDVMGDSRIYAIPSQPKRESAQEAAKSAYEPDMLDEMNMGGGTSRRRTNVSRANSGRRVSENADAGSSRVRTNRADASGIQEGSTREGTGRRSARESAAGVAGGTGRRNTASGSGRGSAYDRENGGQHAARNPENGRGSQRGGRSEFGQSEAKKKRRRRIMVMIIAEIIALVAIFSYAFMARMMAKIQHSEEFEISEIKTNDIAVDAEEQMKGYWTIAIFGVDARDNSIEKSTNSDVIILCNVNRDTGEIKLVSVYRDSYLNINDSGSYTKINQAYFVGGPKQAVEALNRNLDLQIQDYMTFNWKAVANAIDVLGGVDIELSKAEFYYINSFITETVKATGIGSHQLTHDGMNHLDGVQAVAYGRLRLMDTDYARTERQRKVIAQAFEKSKQADMQTLLNLIGAVFPQVSTSIGVDDLVSNAKNISRFHLGETTGFPQARGDANMGKKGAVVVPATLESNVIELHKFLFGDESYTPSETVKKISAKISSDTGIYKEGQFVGNVGTGGGVVQPKKTTAAATKATEKSKDEEGYQTVYEYDKNGKKVSKKLKMETDADGKYIKYETDADGFLEKDENSSTNHASTTVAETDENGKTIETKSDKKKDTDSSSGESGIADSKVTDRPGGTTETTSSSHSGTTSESTAASHPGSTTATTAASHPGSTTATTAASRPGSSESTTSGSSMPTAASHPGGSSTATTAANQPGTSTVPTSPGSGTTSSNGPSGSGNSSSSVSSGTVAGPGQ